MAQRLLHISPTTPSASSRAGGADGMVGAASTLITAPPVPMRAQPAVRRSPPGFAVPPQAWAIGLPLVAAILFFALWQGVTTLTGIPAVILPAPTLVAQQFVQNLPLLLQHAVPTGLEALVGFLLAVVLGVATALAMTASQVVREAIYPLLVAVQMIPKIALAPIFIVWFGIGIESRLIFATFISFFPIAISTATGFQNTDSGALRLCRSLKASTMQTFMLVRFPYALPYLFNGLKIAATMAMIGVIVGEFISAKMGLGYVILGAASKMDTALMLAAIAALCIEGLMIFGAVVAVENFVRRRFWP
jgi:NitT/TauT family transport system permease protein